LNKARFLQNNNYVAVQTEKGRLVLWSLKQIPDVINYVEPFIALTTRNQLQNWQANWGRLRQFQSRRTARDLREWHKERAQVCADNDNPFGKNFHSEFVGH
jgi:hypothetical protein